MTTERRHLIRYSVRPNEIAIFSHGSSAIANVRDISKQGLKLDYHPEAGNDEEWKVIDIFLTHENRYCLSAIPCRVIYDISSLEEGRTFSGSQSRVCGLKFEKLSRRQESELEDLLDSPLMGEIELI